MKCVINDQVVLSRSLEGPIAAHIRAFAASRTALGYARSSLQREIRLAAGFSQWLKQEGIGLRRVDADQVSRYLRVRRRQVLPGPGDPAALRHLLEFLRREGVIAAEPIAVPRLTPAERSVHAYVRVLARRASAGQCDDHELRAVHSRISHRSVRRRTVSSRVDGPRRGAICPASSPAVAPKTRQAPDQRLAVLPPVRALSRRGDTGFGRRRARRRQLVDARDPACDRRQADSSIARQFQSPDCDRAARLRDCAPARATRPAGERSGQA